MCVKIKVERNFYEKEKLQTKLINVEKDYFIVLQKYVFKIRILKEF